jgi:hypothetical protein
MTINTQTDCRGMFEIKVANIASRHKMHLERPSKIPGNLAKAVVILSYYLVVSLSYSYQQDAYNN